MSISSKTRKILWAKSGNRCAICKEELHRVEEDGTETLLGDECHIVAKSKDGPRGKMEPEDDLNSYHNLILLCRNHHKEIDDNPTKYTPDHIKKIKNDHEMWVNS